MAGRWLYGYCALLLDIGEGRPLASFVLLFCMLEEA